MEKTQAVQLNVSKDFPVPAMRLYSAWINPEELRQWWHPMGNTLQRATTEPKLGSPVEYVFAAENGAHSFTISGTYKEVQEGTRLVYTWNWQLPTAVVGDSEFLLTVVFSGQGKGSRIEVTQDNFADEEAVQPHREGWEKALDDLHRFLSQQQ
jgi:uncharacterized protein YndB with AHSA1/START domain